MARVPKPFRTRAQLAHAKARERQRGKTSERGYGWRWQRYRQWFFAQPENVFCRICVTGGKKPPSVASDIDHIKAVSGADDPRFWDPSNHQPLCGECHKRKTVLEDGGFKGKVRRRT